MKAKHYFFIFLLCFPIINWGQSSYHFDKVEDESNPFNSWISDVFEDNKGYIWIGTQEGVVRYDGYEFLHFEHQPNESSSISANWITSINQDKQETFWFGTYGKGLNKLEDQKNSIATFTNDNLSYVKKVLFDYQNTLWVATEKGVYYKLQESQKFYYIKNSNQNSNITLTRDKKVYVLNSQQIKSLNYESEKLDTIFTLDEVPKKIIGGDHGLLVVNKKTLLLKSEDQTVKTLKIPKNCRVWSNPKNNIVLFSNNTEVYRLNISTFQFEIIYSFPVDHQVLSLFIDTKESVWIGTNKGLFKENKLAAKFDQESLPFQARKIISHRDELWAAGNQGLYIINERGASHLLKDKDLVALFTAQNGDVWTGDIFGNLYHLINKKVVHTFQIPFENTSHPKHIYSIVKDRKDRLWISTWSGLFVLNEDRKLLPVKRLNPDSSKLDYKIIKSILDSKDNLWLISPSQGVFRIPSVSSYSTNQLMDIKIENFKRDAKKKQTLASNVIIDIHEDLNSTIWVATDAGINRFNYSYNIFEYVFNQQKLFSEKIMKIQHDQKNILWMSSISKGIFVYNPYSNNFTHYNKKDGLVSDAFLYGSGTLSQNGMLFFGSDNGIQIIKPEEFASSFKIQKPQLTNFKVSDQERTLGELVHISKDSVFNVRHPHQNFSLTFSSLDFRNNTHINYAYKLDGIDKEWRFTRPKNNTAFYTNIGAGTYRFYIKAYDTSKGLNSGSESQIIVNVIPIWYKSSIAYILYGFLGFLLIYLTYRLQIQKKIAQFNLEQLKEEENNKLQRLLDNFHYLGLSSVFSVSDLETIKNNQSEIYGILSYFATSLFDKNTTHQVLTDITRNCISKLNLEDCVIYELDYTNEVLVQKAAHGQKMDNQEGAKIVNPIDIPVGIGIVGTVAKTGKPELINDLSSDPRYIVDDKRRFSELAVPIFLNEKIFGVIDSEHSEKHFFDKGHLEIFKLVAKLLEKKLSQIEEKKVTNITNDNIYYKELRKVMLSQKLYRIPTLSLVDVSEKLNISAGYLSKIINQITQGNFNEFINTFRVEEVKSKLKDPEFSQYSILSIGLECGFNSKSVFYNSFKKITGLSPTEFRKQQ